MVVDMDVAVITPERSLSPKDNFDDGCGGDSSDQSEERDVVHSMMEQETDDDNNSNNVNSSSLTASEWKDRGNTLFGIKKLREALEAYGNGLRVLEEQQQRTEEGKQQESESSSDLTAFLLTNSALAYHRLEDFERSEQCCLKAMEVDPNNVKARHFRAMAIEGRVLRRFEQSRHSPDGNSEGYDSRALLPAIDDLQSALELLDKERLDQDESTPERIRSNNQKWTEDCRKKLERIERKYRRIVKFEQQQKHRHDWKFDTTNKDDENMIFSQQQQQEQQQQQRVEADHVGGQRRQQQHQQSHQRPKPTPESTPDDQVINGQQQSHVTIIPPISILTAADQKKAVVRLLFGRKTNLEKSAKIRHNIPALSSSSPFAPLEGEAFFLLDWNWWVHWCRYVDLFYQQIDNNNDMSQGNIPERVLAVLKLLPPGATVPIKKRKFSNDKSYGIDPMSDDSDDDDDDIDEDCVTPPDAIDNSALVVDRMDRFHQQWYQCHQVSTSGGGTISQHQQQQQPMLRPNLVRGYHYELIPREVYNALRSWYGEVTQPICRRVTADRTVVLYPPVTAQHLRDSNTTTDQKQPLDRCSACRARGCCRKCKHCLVVQYCDRTCQESHWPFHKDTCKAIQAMRKNVIADESSSSSIVTAVEDGESLLPKDRHGRVGLNQLGNTCFMASGIQALSHATPLTRFFLSSRFKADINRDNPLGTGGKLALAYETVMKDLWMKTGIRSTSPVSLKRAIAQFAPRFAGCLQHDAEELLAYLLDGLHEDLNRIRNAPYVEMPDVTNGDNMAVAAAEAWDAHKRRNDSLVMDSFYGQFQSTCVCPRCDRVSVAFDAFNHVSLEIPQNDQEDPLYMAVYLHLVNGSRPFRYGIVMPPQSTVLELRRRMAELTQVPASKLVFAKVDRHEIVGILDDKHRLNSIGLNRCVIVAYESAPVDEPGYIHVVASHRLCVGDNPGDDEEMKMNDSNTSDLKNLNVVISKQPVGLPFLFSAPKETTCRDFYLGIWKILRRLVVSSPSAMDPSEIDTDRMMENDGCHRVDDLLKIRIVDRNARPENSPLLPRDSDNTLADCFGAACTNDYIFLQLEWEGRPLNGSYVVQNLFTDTEDHSSIEETILLQERRQESRRRGVSLDQCFQSFSKPERLDERNMWYCSECKDHVRALKTIKLWRLPNILVVHLKRFEYRHGYRREKLDTYVDFPLEHLDMDPYTSHVEATAEGGSSFVDSSVPAQYDLFAVVNHFGRMGFGHYTAFAKRWDEDGMSEEWNVFDDSNVQPMEPDDVKTPAAYILFYRRRQFN